MIQEDCFAYWPSRCKALKRMVCAEQDYCKFYKTKEQHKTDLFNSEARIRKLYGVSPEKFLESRGIIDD